MTFTSHPRYTQPPSVRRSIASIISIFWPFRQSAPGQKSLGSAGRHNGNPETCSEKLVGLYRTRPNTAGCLVLKATAVTFSPSLPPDKLFINPVTFAGHLCFSPSSPRVWAQPDISRQTSEANWTLKRLLAEIKKKKKHPVFKKQECSGECLMKKGGNKKHHRFHFGITLKLLKWTDGEWLLPLSSKWLIVVEM